MLARDALEKSEGGLSSGTEDNKLHFLMGALLLAGAAILLIASGTVGNMQYYVTVNQLVNNPDYIGQDIRLSGAVLGESIQYDPQSRILEFEIVHLPHTVDNLAVAIHDAVSSPHTPRIRVYMEGEVMPDLLQHGAQAIVTGQMQSDGVFYATELLLKCPTRFEESGLGTQFIPHEIDDQE